MTICKYCEIPATDVNLQFEREHTQLYVVKLSSIFANVCRSLTTRLKRIRFSGMKLALFWRSRQPLSNEYSIAKVAKYGHPKVPKHMKSAPLNGPNSDMLQASLPLTSNNAEIAC